jgi:hypothetical protein
MALSCRNPAISEDHQVQLFTAGLGQQLRTDMALQKPATLDKAVMYARAYARWDSSCTTPPSGRPATRVFSQTPAAPTNLAPADGQASSVASVNSPPTQTLKLTSAEIVQRRKDGKCFHCHDFFSNGHESVCKQLFVIEVIADEERDQPAATEEPTISLHTLTGIQPRSGKTMQLLVSIDGANLNAMLDSGSTHNFIDIAAAQHVGVEWQPSVRLRVVMANGDRLTSPGC